MGAQIRGGLAGVSVDLAWRYWQATGSSEHLNGAIHQGCIRIIDIWSLEQDHAQSTYRHVRPAEPSDTLGRDGSGTRWDTPG